MFAGLYNADRWFGAIPEVMQLGACTVVSIRTCGIVQRFLYDIRVPN